MPDEFGSGSGSEYDDLDEVDGENQNDDQPLSGHAKEFLDELSSRDECEMIGGPMDGQRVPIPPEKDEIVWKDAGKGKNVTAVYQRDVSDPVKFRFVESRID